KRGCLTSPENRKSPLPEFILAGVKSLKSDLLDSPFAESGRPTPIAEPRPAAALRSSIPAPVIFPLRHHTYISRSSLCPRSSSASFPIRICPTKVDCRKQVSLCRGT